LVFALAQLWSGRSSLGTLLKWTLGGSIFILILLEFWRPCYFLTDDNLSGYFPTVTEAGRHLKAGQSPFFSGYIFGGHYNELRDIGFNNWHPLYLLSSLLADTAARFWIIDAIAIPLMLLTAAGFTILVHRLREEHSLQIPDACVIFYTLSFVFSTYILTIGPSWISFLTSQSCLPWLTLGILQEKPLRGTLLVAIFTVHNVLAGFSGLIVSGGLFLTVFAMAIAAHRRSILPLFSWVAGNGIAALVLAPLLLGILDGFAHSRRIQGMPLDELSIFSIPPATFLSSFFLGNWSEPIARWLGDSTLSSLSFPFLSTILACPAAWCVGPALFGGRWGFMDKLCLWFSLVLVWLIVRPYGLAVVMQHLPILKSMRWPFREGMLFLFYIHLFLILRFPQSPPRWRTATAAFSLAMFLLPLPFIRVPTLNPLALDRQLLFSGKADAFWSKVKSTLKPTDTIATVIDHQLWLQTWHDIPYTLLGTANFPCYFQVRSISGYSTTAPTDELPLKTEPFYWFGAFRPDQVSAILAQRPDLKLIRIESTHPLKITISTGNGPAVDLSPDLPQ
jgi:hypothetical protein